MKLLDSSCWTQALRRNGDPAIRARVHALIAKREAAWCDAVRLELWHGALKEFDVALLTDLELVIPRLSLNEVVWERAISNARAARSKGLQLPMADHLIFACAQVHGVELEHADRHFDLLENILSKHNR